MANIAVTLPQAYNADSPLPQAGKPRDGMYTQPRNISVREEVGLQGVRQQMGNENVTGFFQGTQPSQTYIDNTRLPTNFSNTGQSFTPGGIGTMPQNGQAQQELFDKANAHQQRSTSRAFASAPVYPGQESQRDLQREVIPKNHQEFELHGRNIGPHASANVVGGYAGRDKVKDDLHEKFTQRTHDDFLEYYNPHGPNRANTGNASVYSLFDQNRVEARDLLYKDTPGRYAGAFQHDIRQPDHPQDNLAYHQGFAAKPTMKNNPEMVHRQRADENPNREGLRVQYADVYNNFGDDDKPLERLESFRRVQHTVTQDIDPTMIRGYQTNPYTVPIGIVPFSGQNAVDLNTPNQ